MKDFILSLVGLVGFVLGTIWYGYVLTILWSWFIVPVFNLHPLTMLPALGVVLVTKYMTYVPSQTKDTRDLEEKIMDGLALSFVYPLIALFIGWIYISLM